MARWCRRHLGVGFSSKFRIRRGIRSRFYEVVIGAGPGRRLNDRTTKAGGEHCSEMKLEGELDRARAADLVERTETAIRAAGAETARQRLRGAAK